MLSSGQRGFLCKSTFPAPCRLCQPQNVGLGRARAASVPGVTCAFCPFAHDLVSSAAISFEPPKTLACFFGSQQGPMNWTTLHQGPWLCSISSHRTILPRRHEDDQTRNARQIWTEARRSAPGTQRKSCRRERQPVDLAELYPLVSAGGQARSRHSR